MEWGKRVKYTFGQDMGLFDQRQAFLGVAVCAVTSDGNLDEKEVLGLNQNVLRLRIYDGIDKKAFDSMLQRIVDYAQKRGLETLLQASVRAIPDDLRESAFALGADLVLSDRRFAAQESDFLERLRGVLNVDPDIARKVVEVGAIRHKA
ncbi:MAG: tellurite resistance TerB family protein [Euryarchaeota archaeon]|nr:tellurite resistance TerB family protein [Euryarchaeota archaeon]